MLRLPKESSAGERRCRRETCLPRDRPRPKKGSFLPATTLIGGGVWRDSAKDWTSKTQPEAVVKNKQPSGVETRKRHGALQHRFWMTLLCNYMNNIYKHYVRYAVCFVNLFLPSCLMSSVFYLFMCYYANSVQYAKAAGMKIDKVLISFPY